MFTRFAALMMIAMILCAPLMVAPSSSYAEEAVQAADIADHMDKTKYTAVEIKTYMRNLKNKQVVATGKVDNVHTLPRQEAKTVVHVSIPGRSTLFVVDVHMLQAEAGALHKNDTVTCTGTFRRYNPWTLNGIVLQGSCSK